MVVSWRLGLEHMDCSKFRKQMRGKLERALAKGVGWSILVPLFKEEEFFV